METFPTGSRRPNVLHATRIYETWTTAHWWNPLRSLPPYQIGLLALAMAAITAALVTIAVLAAASPAQGPAFDSRISVAVKSVLASDEVLVGSHIQVVAEHGVVTLSGLTNSHHAASVAADDALTVAGVTRVDNQLRTPSVRRIPADARNVAARSAAAP